MRVALRKIFLYYLTAVSRRIIAKYNPKIIGITGSYGKTSSRDAVFALLSQEKEKTVRMTEGELNGEWGIHVAVIGSSEPKSRLKWLEIALKGLWLLITRQSYPSTLVLEMAVDRPGDMDYFLQIARPHIVVMTGIGPTHLEFFGSVQNVAKEKFKLVTGMRSEGILIYNADDMFLRSFVANIQVDKIGYGVSKSANVIADQISYELNDLPDESHTASFVGHIGGVGFRVTDEKGNSAQGYILNVVGKSHIYACLSAVCVGGFLNIPLEVALNRLKNIKTSPGRMRLLGGIKNTIIIDDSYNSSPDAAIHALETLSDLSVKGSKWAVLGEMMELGDVSQESHLGVGKRVFELGIDNLITVGTPAHYIAHGALEEGMSPDNIFEFENKNQAGRFLQSRIKQGDLILIKASRGLRKETAGTRFEKIVKEVMANPQRASELLVSQQSP